MSSSKARSDGDPAQQMRALPHIDRAVVEDRAARLARRAARRPARTAAIRLADSLTEQIRWAAATR